MSEYEYNEKKMSDKVLGFICGCAMHDAIMQQAFKGEKAWIKKVIPDLINPNHKYCQYVQCVLDGRFKDQVDHDYVFNETAKAICKTLNLSSHRIGISTFKFGNAQKLINMTIKHLYSICLCDKNPRKNFRFCHCPMDSIMLDKVWSEYKKYGNDKRRKLLGGTSETFHKSWGNENWTEATTTQCPERYRKFQEAVRDIAGKGVYPIEYDYIVWGEEDEKTSSK